MPTTIAAVLLDLDGTLLDTDAFIRGAFEASLEAAGAGPLDVASYRRIIGQPLASCYASLAPGVDTAGLCEHHRVWQTEHLDMVQPMDGASELLAALRDLEVRRAVVTTRSARSALPSLERCGLRDLLDEVVCGEDVARHKPDPEPLMLALARVGVEPARAVMVGDTPADIDAGRAAGTLTVGVDFGSFGPAIAEVLPDAVISRLLDLLAALGDRLPGRRITDG
jgi:HAD superfamily hydrolase (TIGR01509 family)